MRYVGNRQGYEGGKLVMRGRFDWIMKGKAIFNDWEENGNEIGTR